jgi:DNA-binding response OmpR family regulator
LIAVWAPPQPLPESKSEKSKMMRRADILIVEDDVEMAAILRQGFEEDHYGVTLAHDGKEGLDMAEQFDFQAMVLDVMLPALDGFEVASELRSAGNQIPILMLTALDSLSDKVRGFDCGVEDFLTKPFSFLELSARVRALIRRGQPPPTCWEAGDLVMDVAAHEVSRGHREIRLTRIEFRILEALLRNSGHVVPREELLKAGWGSAGVDDNSLDVTISTLRSKVDRGHATRLIQTVRGFGYRIGLPRSDAR